MSKPRLDRSAHFPYHLNARSNNKDWFYIATPKLWDHFLDLCNLIIERYGVQFHAVVLMSNHFHMILSTPEANIDRAMNYFMRELCRCVNREAGRINHLFGGPYRPSLIQDKVHYVHVLKYLYRNPVKAGICNRVEDYPYSSLQFLLQPSRMRVPLSSSTLDSACTDWKERNSFFQWLNAPLPKEFDSIIRKGLRRRSFKPSIHDLHRGLRIKFKTPS